MKFNDSVDLNSSKIGYQLHCSAKQTSPKSLTVAELHHQKEAPFHVYSHAPTLVAFVVSMSKPKHPSGGLVSLR